MTYKGYHYITTGSTTAATSYTIVGTASSTTLIPIFIRNPSPLNFNRYINGSDLLEEFIKFLGENKVKKSEIFQMPLELFVKWLVIRACEEDQEEPNTTLELPSPKAKPRCLGCGQFMRIQPLMIHNPRCSEYYFGRSSNGR